MLLASAPVSHAALRAPLLLALLFLFLGCAPKSPLEHTVAARTPLNFALWRSENQTHLSRAQWTDFEACVQEIKLSIQFARERTGSEQITALALERIDGRTVFQVLELGWTLKLDRLESERARLLEIVRFNSDLSRLNADDPRSQQLRFLFNDTVNQLEKIIRELRETEAKLDALRYPDPKSRPSRPQGRPGGIVA